VEWAKLTGEFIDQSRDVIASAPTTMFGFVLEEVEAFAKTLKDMDSKIDAQTKDSQGKYDAVWAEMLQLGVRTPENPYSKLTPADMAKTRDEQTAALNARQARFTAELEKLRADDKACRDLAGAADPFVRKIQDNTKQIADCKLDLDPFLALVLSVSGSPTKDELAAVVAFQKVVDDRKIIYNRHTLNNGSDCSTQLSQYQDYTKSKKDSIEADIEHRNLRGLTKETYVEIKQQFDQFDKDHSGFLDKREFRSCLYSVGEERGRKEIDAILTKLGKGDANNIKISYDGYKEFMIEQLGDTDTQEEVVKGFKLMNRQEATCQWPVMQNIMEQHHLDYIKSTHGADYTAWVTSVFAR
jgi:actinin alpha